MKRNSAKKNASATIYIIFFFVMFLAFSAFAIDGAIVLTNRVKLQNATEAAALAAASEFNSGSTVSDSATETFNILKSDSLSSAKVTSVTTDTEKDQVLLTTEYISQPIFLSFLGVTGIKLEAKACAVSEALPVKVQYSGVNWLTSSLTTEYFSDILSKDSSILKPLSANPPVEYVKSASYDSSDEVIYSSIETRGLSLGAGGYVTIKLPNPIIDKPGYDLSIDENGSAIEGYMVFAGLDVDPKKPYEDKDAKGSDIYWVNISSSGTSTNGLSAANAKRSVSTDGLGNQDVFFGDGKFDISESGLSMVKYIRIVDDNQEKAYVKGNPALIDFYGEASTATAGADVASIRVLNHVRLIPPSQYGI